MTLKDYQDNLYVKLQARGWKVSELPPREFLKTVINNVRRLVAQRTRALQYWYHTTSDEGYGDYRVPTNTYMVYAVKYDGRPLRKKSTKRMNELRRFGTTGTPWCYAFYGARGQADAYIQLHEACDTKDKDINIEVVGSTTDLTEPTGECELASMYQAIIEDYLFTQFTRYHGQTWANLAAFMEKEIDEHMNLRVI